MNLCNFVIFFLYLGVTLSDLPPKQYSVDLDLPPKERWRDIFLKHKEYYQKNIKTAINIMFSIVPMRKQLQPLITKVAEKLVRELPAAMAEEIEGIATTLDIDVGDIVLENILYDLTAFNTHILSNNKRPQSKGFCTSIVAQDTNGTIWHARNLDYGFNKAFMEVLQNMTMDIHFTKNGKEVYTATTYAGLTGIFTGQKRHAFTVSLDERNTGSILENILVTLLEKNVSLTSHLIRMVMDQARTFSDAVTMFMHTPTPAPAYIIMGGVSPGQGVVITKDRIKAADTWYMNATKEKWYVLETNYDHWKPVPKSDDRRDVAIKAMNNMGQANVNKESLLKVLSVPPVLNKQTTYTTVMSAANPDIYQTWLREI